MKILVTGGAGFIGSHIVDLLINHGHKVTVVDNLSTGKKENLNPLANFYCEDILDTKIEQIFAVEKPQIVIHHAAQKDIQTSINRPNLDAQINILGTVNLLQHCVRHNVEKVIYASSAAVYGDPEYLGVDEKHPVNPLSFYGISKHTPEHYLQAFAKLSNLKYTILRYANVYGIRQDPKGEGGVVSIFIDKLLKGQSPFIYGDGEQTRDFINVKDIATANLAALTNGDNEIINVSCNRQTTINELLFILKDILIKDIKPIYKEPLPGDILHSYLSNVKAQTILGWTPNYNLSRGLKELIDYYSRP